METKKLITKEGLESLERSLYHAKFVDMPEVIARISEGRSHGDLSENAEYQTAKESQTQLNIKIAKLEQMIANSKVADLSNAASQNTISFGCTVTALNLDTDNEITVKIVGEYESNFNEGKISITSPLAKSMLGKKVDDEFTVTTPTSSEDYQITKIAY